MNRDIIKGVAEGNPLWVTPLALPLALFASQSWYMTAIFALAVPLLLVLTHAIAALLERWFPPDYSLLVVLLVGGALISLTELGLAFAGIILPTRALYLFRSIAVSGVMLWPVREGCRRGESYADRICRITGLALGFLVGLVILSVIRIPIIQGGFKPANSVAFGLFLLALGRIVVNKVSVRGDSPHKENH
ncbi:Rnf-Nqr subunit, membrane protein [Alkalispirochaeta americana]|uniref:Rnf-Nqr subunit, membrane protein n=1 Tax=Alkalispirochaeta americana TaxID=159291 RepID=A0A1N6NAT2_9SPIO|nr:Rnf-Nqr domain containing protein [Alkalispirochaeta americana]SIP89189.1 Rnf-Nqr subunit, membrane protein [Alkalispirochaeta americana]